MWPCGEGHANGQSYGPPGLGAPGLLDIRMLLASTGSPEASKGVQGCGLGVANVWGWTTGNVRIGGPGLWLTVFVSGIREST